jgi:hypothetical protein
MGTPSEAVPQGIGNDLLAQTRKIGIVQRSLRSMSRSVVGEMRNWWKPLIAVALGKSTRTRQKSNQHHWQPTKWRPGDIQDQTKRFENPLSLSLGMSVDGSSNRIHIWPYLRINSEAVLPFTDLHLQKEFRTDLVTRHRH